MSPERELRYLILGAQREGNRQFAALLAPMGLTPAQAEVIAVLRAASPLTLAELGQRLVCETGSPSRLVDSLVKRGLVQRTEAADDRRRVRLQLTPSGVNKAREVATAEAELEAQLQQLPREQLTNALRALRLLLASTTTTTAINLRATEGAATTDR